MPTVDDFILDKFRKLRDGHVTAVEAEGDIVQITRSDQRPTRFGILRAEDVKASDVAPLLEGGVDFVANIPRVGIFQADAIEVLAEHGVSWGGLADAMRATRLDDPRAYVPYPHQFVLDGLKRHQRVVSIRHIDSRRIKVERGDNMPDLVLYVEDSYQAEVASVRFAIDRCSPFDVFVATNPNAGPTEAAIAAAGEAGLEILRWGPLLSRLNR